VPVFMSCNACATSPTKQLNLLNDAIAKGPR
jgi:hypothetical protein